MNRSKVVLVFALLACLCPPALTHADESDDTLGLLVGVLKETTDPAAQADILRGLNAAMEGKRGVKMPAGWKELSGQLASSPNAEVRKQAQKLSAMFGDASTLDAMKKTLLDRAKPADERRKALESLLGKGDPTLAPALQGLLDDKDVREAALKGLASFDNPKTPAAILAAYPSLDEASKRAALNTLSFRLPYAREMMKAAKDNKIATKDLTAYTVRQLRNFNDKEIDAWINQVWGQARSTPEAKIKEIEKYKAMFAPETLKRGDPSAGRALFAKTCMQCHQLYGEGGKVGPDLTGSNRQDLDYILTNILDPSAVIPKDYMVTLVYTKDNDVFSGILVREDANALHLQTESDVHVLQRAEIAEVRRSELSMMPEGLLLPMTPKEIVNLIAYLRTTSQVPLPKQ